MGLKTFATLSDGQEIATPRFFRAEEHALAKARRKQQLALDIHKQTREAVSARVKAEQPDVDKDGVWQAVSQDSEERAAWKHRQRQRKVVACTHELARWKREDLVHQHSRRIVKQFDLIAVEDLTITDMVQKGYLAKRIHDVAWGQSGNWCPSRQPGPGVHTLP